MTGSLHEAARIGRMGELNEVLERGDLDIDLRDENGRTALMDAAIAEVVAGAMLVECNADIDMADNDGRTALMHTVVRDQLRVTSMLLWGGADTERQDENGDTALHLAARHNLKLATDLIMENGGDQTAKMKNNDGKTPMDVAKELGSDAVLNALKH
eukprot:GEMP01058351.1.p1 GENE.GEMP01058351.1~~GEMP01058351.1.p1  ORF type:complete len:157 (+),score=41.30 GEMP01058351.1:27-497(+)